MKAVSEQLSGPLALGVGHGQALLNVPLVSLLIGPRYVHYPLHNYCFAVAWGCFLLLDADTRRREAPARKLSRFFLNFLQFRDRLEVFRTPRCTLDFDELTQIDTADSAPESVNGLGMLQEVFVSPATRDLTEQIKIAFRSRESEIASSKHCGGIESKGETGWGTSEI